VITLHMRLVEGNRGIVTGADPRRMKPTASLRQHQPGAADPSRRSGAALRAGRPGMAAVDVYEEESRCGTPDIPCSIWRTSCARRISATYP